MSLSYDIILPYLAFLKSVYTLNEREPVISLVLRGIRTDADTVEIFALHIVGFDNRGKTLCFQGLFDIFSPNLGGKCAGLYPIAFVSSFCVCRCG